MREYFHAYHSMLEAMRKLSDAECGRLFRGLLYYSMTEEQPDNLQGREELLFDVFSQNIDREIEKYNEKCKTNKKNITSRYQSLRVVTSRNESYQEKEKEEEKDKDKEKEKEKGKRARARFTPPTVDEIKAYADSIGYKVDAQFFFDYYNTAGWKRSDGKPVLNWKQTMQSWKKRDEGKQTQGRSKEWKNPALAYQQREYTDDMFGDDFWYNPVTEYGEKKDKAGDQYDGYIDLDKYGEG